jgi:hypothetical protein
LFHIIWWIFFLQLCGQLNIASHRAGYTDFGFSAYFIVAEKWQEGRGIPRMPNGFFSRRRHLSHRAQDL